MLEFLLLCYLLCPFGLALSGSSFFLSSFPQSLSPSDIENLDLSLPKPTSVNLLYIGTAGNSLRRGSTSSPGLQRQRARADGKSRRDNISRFCNEGLNRKCNAVTLDFADRSLKQFVGEGVAPTDDIFALQSWADLIFVDGGNTFHLHYALHQNGQDYVDLVTEASKSRVYIGVSAGAILGGARVNTASIRGCDDPFVVEDENFVWETAPGLDLANGLSFLPHYDSEWKGAADAFEAQLGGGSSLVRLRNTDTHSTIVNDSVEPPSPPPSSDTRRRLLSLSYAAFIALGTNFLHGTSKLLSLDFFDEFVEATKVDSLYDRKGFKRVLNSSSNNNVKYQLLIPNYYLADQSVELAKSKRRTAELASDRLYEMAPRSKRKRSSQIPDAAFGPAGKESAEENVSVLVSDVMDGFTLQGTLGEPLSALESLLKNAIVPKDSLKTAVIVGATSFTIEEQEYYKFEYIVDRSALNGENLHTISIITERNGDTLITCTGVVRERDFAGSPLNKILSSFKILL